jgi:hypothetical protein
MTKKKRMTLLLKSKTGTWYLQILFSIDPQYSLIGIKFQKTDCYDKVTLCTDKCLPSYCSNRRDKVNIELHIDWSTATQTAPRTTILPYNTGHKEYYISLSSVNDIEFSIIYDYFFHHSSSDKINNYESNCKYNLVSCVGTDVSS